MQELHTTLLRFQFLTAASMKMTVFWDATPCRLIIALMMKAVSTSETSVNFYQTTRRKIPEHSHLHTHFITKGGDYR
jgi:hypothetical protein